MAFFLVKRLKNDWERVSFIFYTSLFFLFSGLFFEVIHFGPSFKYLFQFIYLSALAKMAYKSLVNLYFSFWGLLILLFFYSLFGIFSLFRVGFEEFHLLYTLHICALSVMAFFLASPLFFPKLRWWEYDFRMRKELKVKILEGEEEVPGRLTDIRRSAMGVMSFKNFEVGKEVKVEVIVDDAIESLRGIIFSEREPSFGRGKHYGVKIIKEDISYNRVLHFWKERNSRVFN